MFSDGQSRLLVDGFFTRPSVPSLLFRAIDSDPSKVHQGLGEGQPPVLAILTAHAHHDHALDVAAIADGQKQAIVVGTPSVSRLVQARHVSPDRVCVPADGQRLRFGPYTVTPLYVPHGSTAFFLSWILDHRLNRDLPGPAWFGSYKDNRNLSYLIEYGERRILVHPSAGTPPTVVEAETVFLGLGRVGRISETKARAYWDATVHTGAAVVVPIHWDQFTTELDQPLINTTWLLDDVKKGRRRVCGYAKDRPHLSMVRLDAGEQLILSPGVPPKRADNKVQYCD
jgi:L-ascorbate metabolism protein UlaG (beta-lactamase superfamily)